MSNQSSIGSDGEPGREAQGLTCSYDHVKQGHVLVERLVERHPELVERCEALVADRGYEDMKLSVKLYGKGIKPVIDIRNQWRDGEETRLVKGRENIVYDYRGTVYCHCYNAGARIFVLRPAESRIKSHVDGRPDNHGLLISVGWTA